MADKLSVTRPEEYDQEKAAEQLANILIIGFDQISRAEAHDIFEVKNKSPDQ